MKKLTFLLLTLATTLTLNAQVAINTDASTPNSSAMLDVKSTTKGVLIPRTDTATVNTAGSPVAAGLLIYQTSDNKFYYYSGTKWEVIAAGTNPVFERNGATIRQIDHYNDDYIIGRASLPANGVSLYDKFLFFEKYKGAFRGGLLYGSANWSPDSIGVGSFAYGYNTKAKGHYSTAMGAYSDASGYISTALGRNTFAPSAFETSLGCYNTNYTPGSTTDWNNNDRLFSVGNGTSESARSNALTISKNGDFILSRDKLPANGENVSGNLLFFDQSKGAFRAGVLNYSNDWSPDSIGFGSFAFGYNAKAKGLYSAAWGFGSHATGYYSTSWGYAYATGYYSTAWGGGANATGDYSTAWGGDVKATGDISTAWGEETNATGDYSTAWGKNTYAKAAFETVLGQYNTDYTPISTTQWKANDRLFQIGNGTSSSARSNALTIYKNGDFILSRDKLPANGENVSGNLLFFDQSKGAFRAGTLDGFIGWSPDSIGVGSFAFGNDTKALGNYTAAWGDHSIAGDDCSTAWGAVSNASGHASTAWGFTTKANGAYSTSWGAVSTASGNVSTAWGQNTVALGVNSTAWGDHSKASGDGSTAIGNRTTAFSSIETTLGQYNTDYTPASTSLWNTNDRLFVIGNGASESTKSNALTIYKNGDFILSRDKLPANGESVSDTLLFYDQSKGAFRAGVLGYSNNWSPDSIGVGSFAFGYNSKARGDFSTAWGFISRATGDYSTVWGGESNATGDYSTAWGYYNSATGDYSTAWGINSYATGGYSTAWGRYNYATGDYSTAWGVDSHATGTYSTAWGNNTYVKAGYETALGQYNKGLTPYSATTWDNRDVLFVIGNGTSSSNKHNALTLWKDGRLGLGDAYEPTYALQLPNNSDIDKGQAKAYAWATYSDSRIKFNQKPLPYGLAEIMKLNPKSYIQHSSNFENGILNINNNSGKETIGLIAQEVYKVIPEASNKPEDENKELWSMDYIRLIPVLIKGMQQQQQTIQQQKEENQLQNQTIAKLEERLERLEKLMQNK